MKEQTKLSSYLANKNPWSHNANSIWLASTISLSRNLEKFKFPSHLSGDGRKQIISLVSQELLQSPHLTNPTFLKAEDCTPLDKELLFEHFLTTQSFYQAHSGEAFVVDDTSRFLAVINLPDHLELILSDTEGELENAHSKLVKIDIELSKKLPYAFSPKFGFLTSNPARCGTGLVVQVFLQLPGLIHRNLAQQVITKHKTEGITVTGLHGSPQEHIGDILVVTNTFCWGVTEEKILSTIRTFTTHLLVEEKRVRDQIRQQNEPEIKDKISRAFGLLTFGYQIESVEALNALSLLKMGVDLGWVENVQIAKLNELFFNSRRAHLLTLDQQDVRAEELTHRRAALLHEALHEARLHT